jgi:hypothetical protein
MAAGPAPALAAALFIARIALARFTCGVPGPDEGWEAAGTAETPEPAGAPDCVAPEPAGADDGVSDFDILAFFAGGFPEPDEP